MTDKEKAKEYVDKIKRQYLLSEEGLGCAEQGYLDGLAEGKKETKDYYHKKLTTEYAKHNEEISELKKLYNNEKNKYAECLTECLCLRDEVAELKAQIEKMKCCRNCLYENNDEELVKEMKNNQCPCTDCKKLNYKNWRLYK